MGRNVGNGANASKGRNVALVELRAETDAELAAALEARRQSPYAPADERIPAVIAALTIAAQ